MMMLSYAQNREDVVLARAFDRAPGFYIDVGAASPVINSVTKHFYDHGWHGVNVDPLPFWHEQLERERPRDVNLAVGLAEQVGSLTFYDVSAEAREESTFSAAVAESLRTRGLAVEPREVPVSTLAAVCEQYAPETIDFLKVDVEGLELPVLRGADWSKFRPSVVVVECTHEDHGASVTDFMADAGYVVVLFDGVNMFYVEEDDAEVRERLRAPANALDGFEDAIVVDLESQVATLSAQYERELADSSRRTHELDERIRELERVAMAAQRGAEALQGRLELAERDVVVARRRATDAELQFRVAREALERLLDE